MTKHAVSSIYESSLGSDVVLTHASDAPEVDAHKITQLAKTNCAAINLAQADSNDALIAELDVLANTLGIKKRETFKIGNITLKELETDIAGAIQRELKLDERPKVDELQKDINQYTIPRIAPLLMNRTTIFLSLLLQRAAHVHPGKWHVDSHIDEGKSRILRAVSVAGPDLAASKGDFNIVNGKSTQATNHISTKPGLTIFDGKRWAHRSPGMQSTDGKPLFRAAYVIT